MISNRTGHLMVGLICLSVTQACTTKRSFDGEWKGQYQTTKRGDCGDFAMEISIVNTTVLGFVEVNEPIGIGRLRGMISSQGKTAFKTEISASHRYFSPYSHRQIPGSYTVNTQDPADPYQKYVYSFQGWFYDEQGSRSTDPSKAGNGSSQKGIWHKWGETLAHRTHMLCSGIWEVAPWEFGGHDT